MGEKSLQKRKKIIMPYLKKEDKSMLEKRRCGYKKEGYLKKVGKVAPSILIKCGSKRKH